MIETTISIGDRVRILPTSKESRKYGTVTREGSMDGHFWVEYEDEYGGKIWMESHLETAPKSGPGDGAG